MDVSDFYPLVGLAMAGAFAVAVVNRILGLFE